MACGSTEWKKLTFCPTFHIRNRWHSLRGTVKNDNYE